MMHHFIFLCSLFLSFSLSSSHIFKYLYNFTSRVYSSVCLRGLGGPIRSVQFLNTKQNWMVQGGGRGGGGCRREGGREEELNKQEKLPLYPSISLILFLFLSSLLLHHSHIRLILLLNRI